MLLVVVAIVVLAVVVLALVLLDRVLVNTVERRASEYLSEPFGHPATVRLRGGAFLPQALRGRYRDVEVLGTLRVGDIHGATLVAHLVNVYLPPRALVGGAIHELPCERLTGRLVLPYPELARVVPIPGLSLAFDGERLIATASLPVPGISQLARVGGEAVLSLAAGGELWLRVRGVSVAGLSLPGLVPSQLLPTLNVPVPLPPLPYGLRLDELRPAANGLVVDGSAAAVTFRRPALQDGHPAS